MLLLQPFLPSVGMAPYQWCVQLEGGQQLTLVPTILSSLIPLASRWSEATHGISGPGVHHTAALPGALNTALPITTSCSFNRTMWKATGNAIAREGRAYSNVGLSGLTFWTPGEGSGPVVPVGPVCGLSLARLCPL
jgi:hypothetical protein